MFLRLPLLITLALLALASPASATLPPGNTVEQWNKTRIPRLRHCFKLALVLVRFHHVASRIVNPDHSIM